MSPALAGRFFTISATWEATRNTLLHVKQANSKDLLWEDPLEKEMVTHSVYLLGELHGQEEPGGLQSMGP